MPSAGKLSSVLARYEQTIEKNNAAGVASGMYLTKMASSSKDTSTKTSRSRSNNTLSTSSSHSSKGNERSSRKTRSSIHTDSHERQEINRRPDHKSVTDKNEWNTYLDQTTKSSLLLDDDSCVSEISQDSFGFDDVIPFDDPFENSVTSLVEEGFNPFGLDDAPQPSDASRKQRPQREKRGIGRLGNRTTKAKLDVKATKRMNTKEKAMEEEERQGNGNKEDFHICNDNNNDDDDHDKSEGSGKKSSIATGRYGKASPARSHRQRDESITRHKNIEVDRQSPHGQRSNSNGRKASHSQQQKELKTNDKLEDESSSANDGFSVTYIAKRDVRGTPLRDDSFHSRKSCNSNNADHRSVSSNNRSINQAGRMRNKSPSRRCDGSVHSSSKSKHIDNEKASTRDKNTTNRKNRNNDDICELNPERLSPKQGVKSSRDSVSKSSKTTMLPSRSALGDTPGSRDDANDKELLYQQSGSSAHTRGGSSTTSRHLAHTRKHHSNALDPCSAQMRFFGGGESKIKVRTKSTSTTNTTGSSMRNAASSGNSSTKKSSMDRSDHSKQSYVSNASTKMSTDSTISKSSTNNNNNNDHNNHRRSTTTRRDHTSNNKQLR